MILFFRLLIFASLATSLLTFVFPTAVIAAERVLFVTVSDAQSGEKLSGATVRLLELQRIYSADSSGRVVVNGVPAGKLNVECSRIGYSTMKTSVHPHKLDTIVMEIALVPYVTEVGGATVTAKVSCNCPIGQTPINLSEGDLKRSLGLTVSATLSDEPGVAERSLGPAPARPVLRGLGGNRLPFSLDGQATGDLSATAADHAVTIEPITANNISVIRGPASLLFGSATMAGVVEVGKSQLPTERPDQILYEVTTQGESANKSSTAALALQGNTGDLMWRGSGSLRRAGNIRTPNGSLNNSNLEVSDLSAGLGVQRGMLYLGAAIGHYESAYGIPGGFLGGHANGVDLDLFRTSGDGRLEYRTTGLLDTIRFNFQRQRYYHEELESSGACGVSFGVITQSAELRTALRLFSNQPSLLIGVNAGYRDYRQGCFSFVPPTKEYSQAAVIYQQLTSGRWTLQGSARVDARSVQPQLNEISRDSTKAGEIRERNFDGFSGGLRFAFAATSTVELSASIMQTLSMPATEELFSDGPHLASYAYEVGNTDLSEERGRGYELAVTLNRSRSNLQLSLFHNQFTNFIYPANTGLYEYGPGESGFLSRYQYRGEDAEFFGGELTADLSPVGRWRVGMTTSFVDGRLVADDLPLPSIPPLMGIVWTTLPISGVNSRSHLRWAVRQSELGEFEETTAGYLTAGLSLQRSQALGGGLLDVVLTVDNIFDTEYRNHLSRVKTVMPESGRNISLLLKYSR